MPSLLVTNDFPPKVGGIQSYLYELWRRLPADAVQVFTTPYDGARAFDAAQSFRIRRARRSVLLPTRDLTRRVNALAREMQADLIFVDPMLPLGLVNAHLDAAPNVVIAHGAEITVPGRLPIARQLAKRVLRHTAGVLAAGGYPAAMAARVHGHALPTMIVPPGVDVERFTPTAANGTERSELCARYGLDPARPIVLGLSRLVPRKGFDVLIDAVGRIGQDVQLVIGGKGRDRERLEHRAAARRIDARFVGRVDDADLPALYRSVDVFAMLCRDRWAGLEAEGFGIVFLEAAACGVPQLAGRSGGAHEAVEDGVSGLVVDPRSVGEVTAALRLLLEDDARRAQMGLAARERAVAQFSYDVLAARLAPLARGDLRVLSTSS
ncbi:MAG: glycosyltransferase family 4 protein [Acidimicrobiia bacterium]